MNKWIWRASSALVIAVSLTACGGGDDSSPAVRRPTIPTPAKPSTPIVLPTKPAVPVPATNTVSYDWYWLDSALGFDTGKSIAGHFFPYDGGEVFAIGDIVLPAVVGNGLTAPKIGIDVFSNSSGVSLNENNVVLNGGQGLMLCSGGYPLGVGFLNRDSSVLHVTQAQRIADVSGLFSALQGKRGPKPLGVVNGCSVPTFAENNLAQLKFGNSYSFDGAALRSADGDVVLNSSELQRALNGEVVEVPGAAGSVRYTIVAYQTASDVFLILRFSIAMVGGSESIGVNVLSTSSNEVIFPA